MTKRRKLTRKDRRAANVARFTHLEKDIIPTLKEIPDAPALCKIAREKLEYGQDWFYAQHKQPAYSDSGRSKLFLALASLAGERPPLRKTVTIQPNRHGKTAAMEPLEFEVTGTMPNPTQVYAKDKDNNPKRVIVGDSKNFIVGMKLKAVPHPDYPGWFLLHGPTPKYKGRW